MLVNHIIIIIIVFAIFIAIVVVVDVAARWQQWGVQIVFGILEIVAARGMPIQTGFGFVAAQGVMNVRFGFRLRG